MNPSLPGEVWWDFAIGAGPQRWSLLPTVTLTWPSFDAVGSWGKDECAGERLLGHIVDAVGGVDEAEMAGGTEGEAIGAVWHSRRRSMPGKHVPEVLGETPVLCQPISPAKTVLELAFTLADHVCGDPVEVRNGLVTALLDSARNNLFGPQSYARQERQQPSVPPKRGQEGKETIGYGLVTVESKSIVRSRKGHA
ncbi:MAG TPA: hypothetical protein VFK86_19665 [Bauldia sp.]|nr:hypothetical protein [Bauldia sp.]